MKKLTAEMQLEMVRRIYRRRHGMVVIALMGAFLAAANIDHPDKSYLFFGGIGLIGVSVAMYFVLLHYGRVSRELEASLKERSSNPPTSVASERRRGQG
jgi:uncharacterized membrane protein